MLGTTASVVVGAAVVVGTAVVVGATVVVVGAAVVVGTTVVVETSEDSSPEQPAASRAKIEQMKIELRKNIREVSHISRDSS